MHRYLACCLLAVIGLAAHLTLADDANAADGLFAVPSRVAPETLPSEMATLAQAVLSQPEDSDDEHDARERLQLALATGEIDAALAIFNEMDKSREQGPRSPFVFAYGIYTQALSNSSSDGSGFEQAYEAAFEAGFSDLDDRAAFERIWWLETPGFLFSERLERIWEELGEATTISRGQASELVRAWLAARMNRETAALIPELVRADQERRYVIDERLMLKADESEDGPTISAILVRPRNAPEPLPTALVFTIYADPAANLERALVAASYGYVGIVAHSRGKYLSEADILPYEHEVEDTHRVLDWIVDRPWSNGDVGMYGGSYEGFAAWAAMKRPHPALKTIVPYAAAIPGQGLPMTNNVFLNANYGWVFFVTNNQLLDHETYGNRQRWGQLFQDWYVSGRPYREIDQIDGTPNPYLQRWLDHPTYDAYWQNMVPYGEEFSSIDIPILSITGYYDDGQISALQYLRDHLKHRPDAEHYLVIGPYDHFGVSGIRKSSNLRGYEIDPVANFNTQTLTFEWLDHTLRGGPRPALIKGRINYQVMGANQWRHAPTIDAMAERRKRLYLVKGDDEPFNRLAPEPPDNPAALEQTVDLADRLTVHNDYYPAPILGRDLNFDSGLVYVSEPLSEPIELNGMFAGQLTITINKRDVDLGAVLYEQFEDGRLFHLAYWLGRASHAGDRTTRTLLVPGEPTTIPIGPTTLVSRRLNAGSRLVLVVDVNKNPWHQINYGTGRDVSEVAVDEAGPPLEVNWHETSYLELPITRSR